MSKFQRTDSPYARTLSANFQCCPNTQSQPFWQHSCTYTFAVMRMSTYMDLWTSVQLSLITDGDKEDEALGILTDISSSWERDRQRSKPRLCLLAPSHLVLYLSSDKNIWQHKASSLCCNGADSSNWQYTAVKACRRIWTKYTYNMSV